ncbi:hypothetical protein RHSIM_Rhsim13G0033800 [Rhododendron simsii]|uniref:Protease Do-like PDZ domain-containing protein n=1 Tax=Rhododendron simsii TaxID=118357 RepID=A0A834G3F4_RHOSS|nr:hypothetical protein RHSIM_Rhsim13G0033800 [Rhododendron simsii]
MYKSTVQSLCGGLKYRDVLPSRRFLHPNNKTLLPSPTTNPLFFCRKFTSTTTDSKKSTRWPPSVVSSSSSASKFPVANSKSFLSISSSHDERVDQCNTLLRNTFIIRSFSSVRDDFSSPGAKSPVCALREDEKTWEDMPQRDAVVSVSGHAVDSEFAYPWTRDHTSCSGTGLILSGRRVLTTAHSVDNHTFLEVRNYDYPKSYTATMLAIAPEHDLAILTVDDDEFWEGLKPVEFGDTPSPGDKVIVDYFREDRDSLLLMTAHVLRLGMTRYPFWGTELLAFQEWRPKAKPAIAMVESEPGVDNIVVSSSTLIDPGPCDIDELHVIISPKVGKNKEKVKNKFAAVHSIDDKLSGEVKATAVPARSYGGIVETKIRSFNFSSLCSNGPSDIASITVLWDEAVPSCSVISPFSLCILVFESFTSPLVGSQIIRVETVECLLPGVSEQPQSLWVTGLSTWFTSCQVNVGSEGAISSGPAFDERGKCVGLKLQSKGNKSDFIPTEVIKHFIQDYDKNGAYTGLPLLGIKWQEMENTYLRAFMKMEHDQQGILITEVKPNYPESVILKPYDVILSIDGININNDGTVPFLRGRRIEFSYLISKKYKGDKVLEDDINYNWIGMRREDPIDVGVDGTGVANGKSFLSSSSSHDDPVDQCSTLLRNTIIIRSFSSVRDDFSSPGERLSACACHGDGEGEKRWQEDMPQRDNVVAVHGHAADPDFSHPWRRDHTTCFGIGLIISGRRVLTTAHSVDHHTLLKVSGYYYDNSYRATMLAIAPECDLAILTVDDDEFWEERKPVEFGDMPSPGDKVIVDHYREFRDYLHRMTARVLSLGMTRYSFWGTELLAFQVTALPQDDVYDFTQGGYAEDNDEGISVLELVTVPKESGAVPSEPGFCQLAGNKAKPIEPAHVSILVNVGLKEATTSGLAYDERGKCVGLKLQSKGNKSDFIPVEVIKHFIQDYDKNGAYTGLPLLGIKWQGIENPYMHAFLKMEHDQQGILITEVMPNYPESVVLKPYDVILSIDGINIDNYGTVPFLRGDWIEFSYLIGKKYTGDKVVIKVLRGSAVFEFITELATHKQFVPANIIGRPVRYYIIGGFVFTTLSLPYIQFKHRGKVGTPDEDELDELFSQSQALYEEHVVLCEVLNDAINDGACAEYLVKDKVLVTFNNKSVEGLKSLVSMVETCNEDFMKFTFGNHKILVLPTNIAKSRTPDILKVYSISCAMSDDLKELVKLT